MGYSYCIAVNGEWLNEHIPYLRKNNWLYRFVCFCLGKSKSKLTYQEMFVLLYGLNRNKLGEKVAKEKAAKEILSIYKIHHKNKLPEGIY